MASAEIRLPDVVDAFCLLIDKSFEKVVPYCGGDKQYCIGALQ